MNIAMLLAQATARSPLSPAVFSATDLYANYQQLEQRVASIAYYLRNDLSHQAGDRVALIMKNCPQYIEILLGVLHAGLAVVPINAKLHKNEFDFILANADVSSIFISPIFEDIFPAAEENSTPVICIDSDRYQSILAAPALDLQERAGNDLAWLFYTSGTTGQPKGAMISHRNLLAMTMSYFSSVDQIDNGASILHAAPMSHGSGLYIFPHIAHGARQVVCEQDGFDEQEIFTLLQYHPQVALFAAPTMIHRLVNSSLSYDPASSQLKTIIYGGGPMYVADIKAAMARFGNKFVQIYGQGETPMTITCLTREDHGYRQRHTNKDSQQADNILASVGTAQLPVQIQIADTQGTRLSNGEIGEILVKGDTVMLGYWADPAATSRSIVDGWLYTGDLGSLDQQGYLTLKDRSKDMIISGGTNIYPREVEEALLLHPQIDACAVVGKPDPEWGESVIAFVIAAAGSTLSVEICDAWCIAHIARFKRPKNYHFVQTLPKNNYGKVLKTALREQLLTLEKL